MTAPRAETGDSRAPEETEDVVIDLRSFRDTSRYRRQSGALPRLTDDPDYEPASSLPQPVNDPGSLWARLRARLTS